MIILGIETSCDETAAAVVQKQGDRITILSNVVASSAQLQAKYGGVIPEQAAREQLKSIIPVIEESLQASGTRQQDIDAIAVTYGPGLIGSLLIGIETAKTLSMAWDKPLIPVNHLIGHFYANWIKIESSVIESRVRERRSRLSSLATSHLPQFPAVGLLISGGHTDLILFKDHHEYEYLGGTRDDAAGECFDKCARLLGLPYPGGPEISKLAIKGNPSTIKLPRPMIDSGDFDFSFSGLKTAVANLVHSSEFTVQSTNYLCASVQQSIVDVLVKKSIQAVKKFQVNNLIVAGGVAANEKFREELRLALPDITISVPAVEFCTDNAAMIATAAFFLTPAKNPFEIQADPNLALTT